MNDILIRILSVVLLMLMTIYVEAKDEIKIEKVHEDDRPNENLHIKKTVVPGREVYVVSHGWHTGFVISSGEIQLRFPKLKERFKSTPYLEIGWGDKGFYQAKEITTGLTFRALFWPTETVIHAVAVPENVNAYFPNSQIEMLCLNDEDYLSLIDFVSNSFYSNREGDIVALEKGIYGNSQFYKGVGNFHLLQTCNNWTAKGLKSTGMEISPTFKLTANNIMDYIQKYIQSLNGTSVGRGATVVCR